MEIMRLTFLGDCRVADRQDALIDLPLAKARALLVYLAMNERPVARSRLVDLLWSELGAEAARRNLRVVLTQLRQAVGDYVEATHTTIAFRRDLPYWLDVEEFVAGVQCPPPNNGAALSRAVADALARSLALYQGDFLEGLEVHNAPLFEEWMLLERERFRRLVLTAGQRLINHYVAAADDPAALTVCQRLLALEPYSEELHRQCMSLLARTGQRSAALQQYERCRQMLATELVVEPDTETLVLYEEIRRGTVRRQDAPPATSTPAPPTPPRHRLPLPTTPFVGREAELAQLIALLPDPTCRLVTLVGPGGIGKTRLALQAAATVADNAPTLFADGLFFVAATAMTTLADLIPSMAAALGLHFTGHLPPETQLLNHLRSRRLLLLLDNFEQLVTEAAALTTWLQQAPGLRLLVTSRERLKLYDEWLLPVEGLPVPPVDPAQQPADPAAYAAVQLFVQRARRVNLGFSLVREATHVAAICTLLQGHPLAIELAAGWVHTHSCAEILAEVQRNLDFLANTLRDRPERHQSLRATFAHAWGLLATADAAIYKRLALLRSGFTAESAAAVANANSATLARLVDKSLLQRSPGQRYTIHELLRQYAVQQLTAAEEDATIAAYSRYMARQMAIWEEWRETAREPEALAALEPDVENLRLVWQWLILQLRRLTLDTPPLAEPSSLDDDDLLPLAAQLSSGITYFFLRRSRYQEGRQWVTLLRTALPDLSAFPKADRSQIAFCAIQLDYAEILFNQSEFAEIESLLQPLLLRLRTLNEAQHLATALTILGRTYMRMGRYDAAETLLQEALARHQQSGLDRNSTAARNALGILYSNQGRFAEAETHYRACLAIFEAQGYQRGLANATNNLGSNFARNGCHREALPLYEQTFALAQAVGEALMIAIALSNLGSVSRALGAYEAAERYYQESLTRCRAIGERRWTVAGLNGLGLTLLEQERFAQAAHQYSEAFTLAQEIGSQPDLIEALAGLGELAFHKGKFPQAATLLHFVAHHPLTQPLARQRSQALLPHLPLQLTPAPLPIAPFADDTTTWQTVIDQAQQIAHI